MAKKLLKKKTGYDAGMYEYESIDNLILLGIYFTQMENKECTFERLVEKCFSYFPKVFSFSQYRNWPDSRKLDRPLRELREKRLIVGNPKTFFSLTKEGKKLAQEIAKGFGQKKLIF
jgi:hypothetical protein